MCMTVLQGPLADRDAWSAVGHCPIEKTMAIAGTKSAMLIMREAFYGTTRFDDFARRVGITKAATSARLAELVGAGLLTKQSYREPGQRARDEYVLTESGTEFVPVVFAISTHAPRDGHWKGYIPGPIEPVPWMSQGQLADNQAASDLKDGESLSLDSRFKLKNDVIGKTL